MPSSADEETRAAFPNRRTTLMVGFGFAVLAAGVLGGPSPAPSPTPLEEIGRVRSSVLCTALRENVRLALLRIVDNAVAIDRGRSQLERMATDQVRRAGASLRFDRIAVDGTVTQIAQNIASIRTQLGDARRFPPEAATDDERKLLSLKAELEAVVSDQNDAVNVLNGTVETDRLGEMQTEGLHSLQGAAGPDQPTAPSATAPNLAQDADIVSFLGFAGLAPGLGEGFDPLHSTPNGLVGNTAYDQMASVVGVTEARSERGTRLAEKSIVQVWRSCGGGLTPTAAPPVSRKQL